MIPKIKQLIFETLFRHETVLGATGTTASFTLADVNAIAASCAGFATGAYMIVKTFKLLTSKSK